MSKANTRDHLKIQNPQTFFTIFGVALFGVILLRNLWIGDDAFITLRVVDNWVHGHGLTWNTSERVQVFTHPLWLFVITLFYIVRSDPYFTFYASSFVISVITVIFLFHRFSPSFQITLLGSFLLVGSSAFLDYSSSGLENPLSHLLLLIFLGMALDKSRQPDLKQLFWMSLLAGLAALNRTDTVLFYLPLLIYQWAALRGQWVKASLVAFAGFLPIIFWELFSLMYYGFLFPNTYPAKLNTTVSIFVFIQHGIFYILNSLDWDPLTLSTFFLAAFFTLAKGDLPKKLALSGGAIYFLYTIWIGGDFMAGRFFSILFLLSVVLLFTSDLQTQFNLDDTFSFGLTLLLIFLIQINTNAHPLFIQADSRSNNTQNGIANEKLFYYFQSGWLNQWGRFTPPLYGGPEGIQAKQVGKSPIFDSTIGAFGYYAGPDIYIIDSAALTDPLLARIPYSEFDRPGHYIRTLPEGYVESFEGGFANKIQDQNLRTYFDKLSVITRGKIFTTERLKMIWEFNTGQYDHLMIEYMNGSNQ